MCGFWDWQSTIVKDLSDSQDPKHTLFCRESAFVAIYVLFSDNKCLLFLPFFLYDGFPNFRCFSFQNLKEYLNFPFFYNSHLDLHMSISVDLSSDPKAMIFIRAVNLRRLENYFYVESEVLHVCILSSSDDLSIAKRLALHASSDH